jgi:hypothetical protein
MLPVIAILGLMAFTWAIAMYATNLDEPHQKIGRTEETGKAA